MFFVYCFISFSSGICTFSSSFAFPFSPSAGTTLPSFCNHTLSASFSFACSTSNLALSSACFCVVSIFFCDTNTARLQRLLLLINNYFVLNVN